MDLECVICLNLLSEGPDLSIPGVEEPPLPAKRKRGRPSKRQVASAASAPESSASAPSTSSNRGDLRVTSCGHAFHTPCIISWINKKRECPSCRKVANLNDLVPLYLPTSDQNQCCKRCRTTESEIDALKKENEELKSQVSANRLKAKEGEAKMKELEQHNCIITEDLAGLKKKYEEEMKANGKLELEQDILKN